MSNRLEKFRLRRSLRKKYLSAASVFLLLLAAGLASADYATNFLMTGRQGIALAEVNNKPAYTEIVLLNQKFHINTQYLNRDLERFKKELSRLADLWRPL